MRKIEVSPVLISSSSAILIWYYLTNVESQRILSGFSLLGPVFIHYLYYMDFLKGREERPHASQVLLAYNQPLDYTLRFGLWWPLHLLDKILLGTAFKIPPDLIPASLFTALLPLPPPCSSHIRLLELSSKCAIHPCLLFLLAPEPLLMLFSFTWNALLLSFPLPIYPSWSSSNNPLFCESFPDLFKQHSIASSALYTLSYNLLHIIDLIYFKCMFYFLSVLYALPICQDMDCYHISP